jgi:hypothetical protein
VPSPADFLYGALSTAARALYPPGAPPPAPGAELDRDALRRLAAALDI